PWVASRNLTFSDDARRGDASDLPARELAEPHVPVAPERRCARLAVRRRDVELADDACRRNAPHAIAEVFGEPHVAVGSGRDDARRAAGMRKIEFSERAAVLRHAPDAIARAFRKP